MKNTTVIIPLIYFPIALPLYPPYEYRSQLIALSSQSSYANLGMRVKRVAHKEDIFIDLQTKMGNIYRMIFMRDYHVKKSGKRSQVFLLTYSFFFFSFFFKSHHIQYMNYECTTAHESGNMLSAKQLYVLEMYRALSEESLRAL